VAVELEDLATVGREDAMDIQRIADSHLPWTRLSTAVSTVDGW